MQTPSSKWEPGGHGGTHLFSLGSKCCHSLHGGGGGGGGGHVIPSPAGGHGRHRGSSGFLVQSGLHFGSSGFLVQSPGGQLLSVAPLAVLVEYLALV
jgi:hypothetical protein